MARGPRLVSSQDPQFLLCIGGIGQSEMDTARFPLRPPLGLGFLGGCGGCFTLDFLFSPSALRACDFVPGNVQKTCRCGAWGKGLVMGLVGLDVLRGVFQPK